MRSRLVGLLALAACADDLAAAKDYRVRYCAQFPADRSCVTVDGGSGGGSSGTGGGSSGSGGGSSGTGGGASPADAGPLRLGVQLSTSLPAGSCKPGSVIAVDQNGVPTTVTGAIPMIVRAVDAGLFSDELCQLPLPTDGGFLLRGDAASFHIIGRIVGPDQLSVVSTAPDVGGSDYPFDVYGQLYVAMLPWDGGHCVSVSVRVTQPESNDAPVDGIDPDVAGLAYFPDAYRSPNCSGNAASAGTVADAGDFRSFYDAGAVQAVPTLSRYLHPVNFWVGRALGATAGPGTACQTGSDCAGRSCGAGVCQCVMTGGACQMGNELYCCNPSVACTGDGLCQ